MAELANYIQLHNYTTPHPNTLIEETKNFLPLQQGLDLYLPRPTTYLLLVRDFIDLKNNIH